MALVRINTLAHPVIISATGRAPVVAQSGTGLNGSAVPSAKQFASIKSVATTRQPQSS